MIVKSYLNLSKEEFLDVFLELVNLLQNEERKLTKTQRIILREFLLLDDKIFKFTRFGALGKKAVMQSLKEKYGWEYKHHNMNIAVINYTKKGFVYKDVDSVKYLNKGLKLYLEKVATSKEPQDITFRLSVKNDDSSERLTG